MINSNELRIGNIVMVNKCFTRVFSIANDGINHTIDNLGHAPIVELEKLSTLSGIELTPEILEKCKLPYIEGEYHSPDVRYEEGIPLRLIGLDDGWIGKEVKYLHQLQNIYFALSGEELTYTP